VQHLLKNNIYQVCCVFYCKQPTYNPQMKNGEPYDKGYRKDQFTGSYGDFTPRHVKKVTENVILWMLYFMIQMESTIWNLLNRLFLEDLIIGVVGCFSLPSLSQANSQLNEQKTHLQMECWKFLNQLK